MVVLSSSLANFFERTKDGRKTSEKIESIGGGEELVTHGSGTKGNFKKEKKAHKDSVLLVINSEPMPTHLYMKSNPSKPTLIRRMTMGMPWGGYQGSNVHRGGGSPKLGCRMDKFSQEGAKRLAPVKKNFIQRISTTC